MQEPPPGYDDSSAIPRAYLLGLLDRFEDELQKTDDIFRRRMSGEFQLDNDLIEDFWNLRHTAEELGGKPFELVQDLMISYESFKQAPSPTGLEMLLGSVRTIKKDLQEV